MGKGELNNDSASALNGLQSNIAGEPQLSVADLMEYTPPDLTPDQQQNYDTQNYWNNNPPLEKLDQTDYYPGLNDPIAKGSYSGPQIGSLTLFAPGGGIAPVAMNDARERALAGAASKKAKEVDDFYKSIKAPETKLKAVQPELQKGFYDWMGKSIADAKKVHGDNAYNVLKNDVDFQRGIQRWNTVAQYNTQIADDIASFEEQMKDEKFIADPETIKLKEDVKQGYMGLQDPNDPKARDLVKNWGKYKAHMSMDLAINDALEKSVAEQSDALGIAPKDFYDLITTTKTTYYPPEKIRTMAENIHAQRYAGDPTGYFSIDKIEAQLTAKLGKKVDKTAQTVTRPNPPAGSGDTDYSDDDDMSNTEVNYNPERALEGDIFEEDLIQRATVFDKSVKMRSDDSKKDIIVSKSKDLIAMDGRPLTKEDAIKGKGVSMVNVKRYKPGSFVLKVDKDGTKRKVDVSGQLVPKFPKGKDPHPSTYEIETGVIIASEETDPETGEVVQRQFYQKANGAESNYKAKSKRPSDVDGYDKIQQLKKEATEANKINNKKAKSTPVSKADAEAIKETGGGSSKSTTNQKSITTSKIDPSTLVVGQSYNINGQERVWNGSKLVLKK